MILDALWLFTGGSGGVGNNDGKTDSPTTGTQNSSNIVDLAGPALPASATPLGGTPGRDLGIGDDPALKLLVQVTTAFTTGTNLTINFQGAPDNGSGGVGGYNTYVTGPVIGQANLTIGQRLLDIDYPRTIVGAPEPPRFVRLGYVSTGSSWGAGALEGLVVLDRFDQIINVSSTGTAGGYLSGYPAGITIAN